MVSSARPRECSVARTLEVVGEKWALLAVREVFLGNRRFDEMVRRTGAPRDTMAARLRVLVGSGVLERRQYCEHPARFEYHLTAAGRDLYPVIMTLMQWGDKYLAGDGGPPLMLKHSCGHTLGALLACEYCGQPVTVGSARPWSTEPDRSRAGHQARDESGGLMQRHGRRRFLHSSCKIWVPTDCQIFSTKKNSMRARPCD